jgi:hypothetical protein
VQWSLATSAFVQGPSTILYYEALVVAATRGPRSVGRLAVLGAISIDSGMSHLTPHVKTECLLEPGRNDLC